LAAIRGGGIIMRWSPRPRPEQRVCLRSKTKTLGVNLGLSRQQGQPGRGVKGHEKVKKS